MDETLADLGICPESSIYSVPFKERVLVLSTNQQFDSGILKGTTHRNTDVSEHVFELPSWKKYHTKNTGGWPYTFIDIQVSGRIESINIIRNQVYINNIPVLDIFKDKFVHIKGDVDLVLIKINHCIRYYIYWTTRFNTLLFIIYNSSVIRYYSEFINLSSGNNSIYYKGKQIKIPTPYNHRTCYDSNFRLQVSFLTKN